MPPRPSHLSFLLKECVEMGRGRADRRMADAQSALLSLKSERVSNNVRAAFQPDAARFSTPPAVIRYVDRGLRAASLLTGLHVDQ